MVVPQRFAVYHAKDPLAMAVPRPYHWLRDRDVHYRHVADIAAPLEQVFERTNHHGANWTHNPEILWYDARLPPRSTSVGDVFVSCETGRAWMVLPVGFQPL
jgi:hypothetical protein